MLPHHPSAIEWEESILPPPPPEPMPPPITAHVKSAFMDVPPWTQSLLWCPWVVTATVDSIAVPAVHLDVNLIVLLRLVVAQDNSCRYCYGTARTILRILGYSEDFVRTLEHDLFVADLSARYRAALDYARLISRANPPPGAAQRRALLDLGYTDAGVAELAVFAALFVMATRVTTLGAVAPHPMEAMRDRWWLKLARPLTPWIIRRKMRSIPPAVADPARRIPAFDDLIGMLGDLPAAASLRKIVDAAFGDGPLPRRTRVIVGAVIARALGCAASEQQLISLLGDGSPDRAAIDTMLTRLEADWLDERERLLIPVARDTMRTQQPRLIQRRMRELGQKLTPAELVDFIGVASVANAIGRLGVLLQRC